MSNEHINAPETGCTPEEQAAWHAGIDAGREIERNNAAASAEPVAWAAVHFGGRRDGKIYTTCDTREQIEAYIQDVHQSSDSLTLRARPLAFADAPVAAQARPAISGYTCTVPDDCEILHWRGQILSMNELASVAQPAVGEEIHVHIEGQDVLTLPLIPVYMDSCTPAEFDRRVRAWGQKCYEAGRAALAAQAARDDEMHTQALEERDRAEGWADGLANLIGQYFGEDVGEHSNMNSPWERAKAILENALAAQASRQDGQDPLQPAVDWLYRAVDSLLVADVQSRLLLGPNRAGRLLDAARAAAKGE